MAAESYKLGDMNSGMLDQDIFDDVELIVKPFQVGLLPKHIPLQLLEQLFATYRTIINDCISINKIGLL